MDWMGHLNCAAAADLFGGAVCIGAWAIHGSVNLEKGNVALRVAVRTLEDWAGVSVAGTK